MLCARGGSTSVWATFRLSAAGSRGSINSINHPLALCCKCLLDCAIRGPHTSTLVVLTYPTHSRSGQLQWSGSQQLLQPQPAAVPVATAGTARRPARLHLAPARGLPCVGPATRAAATKQTWLLCWSGCCCWQLPCWPKHQTAQHADPPAGHICWTPAPCGMQTAQQQHTILVSTHPVGLVCHWKHAQALPTQSSMHSTPVDKTDSTFCAQHGTTRPCLVHVSKAGRSSPHLLSLLLLPGAGSCTSSTRA
jgi:hypothetical protein